MPIDRRILAELRRRQQNGLFAVAVELTNRAKVLATKHHDNGTRRNSITQTKSSDGRTVLWGIPAKAAPHGPHLEFGFKPHWVPGRHIGLWMTRNKVGSNMTAIATLHGVTRRRRYVSRKRSRAKAPKAQALGLFVGGPGSTLQVAPGGTQARFFAGRKRFKRWHYYTKGGISRYLRPATVGHPILQPTAAQVKSVPLEVYKRGFQRGR